MILFAASTRLRTAAAARLGATILTYAFLAGACHWCQPVLLSEHVFRDANRLVWAALVSMFLVVDNTYVICGLIALMCLIGPTGSTAVVSRQMALTPDELQGRVGSARGFLTGLAGPVGAGLIGFSLDFAALTESIVILCARLLAMAAIAFASRSIRSDAAAPAHVRRQVTSPEASAPDRVPTPPGSDDGAE